MPSSHRGQTWLEQWKRKSAEPEDSSDRGENDEFLGAPARVVAEFSAKALVANYRAIRDQVPNQAMLPMVKANGYGHGADWVARQLLNEDGLYGFGVATLREGAKLREGLGPSGRRARIVVFSGCGPWTEEKGSFCEKHGLTPVLASDRDWQQFSKQGWAAKIPYELKFNTGMNRLGISPQLAPSIAKFLRAGPAEAHPQGICSHLAMGETPDSALSHSQKEKFIWLRGQFQGVVSSTHFHLGNSAAIWNQKHWSLKDLTDVVRPGLSLYGVQPWPGAPERGIFPVMTLRASVLAVHRLKPGESLGYGAHFKVTGTKPVNVAILGAGYGDGLTRTLSGHMPGGGGHVWLSGRAERMLGVVSMDLCATGCAAETKPGDWAEIIGPHVDPWAQAQAAGTIPYELLTSVSGRVQKIYG